METLTLKSPAKVNLRLEILRRRKDGYHELRTIYQKINLSDTLYFSLKKGKGISIETDHPGLSTGEDNLVYRAIRLATNESGYRDGMRVKIEKRIPLGAGLGGGSSNAASTLMAMDRLLGLKLSKKRLMEMGLQIGADVPFFFLRGAAVASGVGEKLKRIELPSLWFVLIYPNFEVSTRWAYQNFVLTRARFRLNLQTFPRSLRGISSALWNDLESVVSKEHPQIEEMKAVLVSSGSLGTLMTGSGPTVFGIFSADKDATSAYRKVKKIGKGKSWIVLKAHSIP